MKYLFKSQWHKFKFHKLSILSIAFVLLIISATGSLLSSTFNRIEAPYNAYKTSQNVEDFYIIIGNIDFRYLTAAQQVSLCQELGLVTECSLYSRPNRPDLNNYLNLLIQDKLGQNPAFHEAFLDALIANFSQSFQLTVEKTYVADVKSNDHHYKLMRKTEQINTPYLVAGTLPRDVHEIAIYEAYAKLNHIALGDTLTIGDHQLTVSGFIYQVDYSKPLFSISELAYDARRQTLVLAHEDVIKTSAESYFIKYVGRGDIRSLYTSLSITDLMVQDASALGKNMQMAEVIVLRDYNPRIEGINNEIHYASMFLNVFLTVFYAFVFLLVFLFSERLFKKNIQDVHVLKALGYTHHEISLALLTLPLLMNGGLVIGFVIGQALSSFLYPVLTQGYLIPRAPYTFSMTLFLLSVVIPYISISLIMYVRFRFYLNKRHTHKKPFLTFKFVRFEQFVFHCVLYVTLSFLVLLSFSATRLVDDFIDETSQGNHYEEMVLLSQFRLDDAHEDTAKLIRTRAFVSSINSNLSLYGLHPETAYKRLIADDVANNALLQEGFIVSAYTAQRFNVIVGDTLTLIVGHHEVTRVVLGISNERIESAVYMDIAALASLFNLSDTAYNGYFSLSFVQDTHVFERINYHKALSEVENVLNLSKLTLSFIAILAFYLSVYVLFFSNASYFHEEETVIASLKSLGYSTAEIMKRYIPTLLVSLVFGFMVAYALTPTLFTSLLNATLLESGLAFQATVTLQDLGITALLLIATFTLSVMISLHIMRRVSIAVLMKKDAL